MMNSFCEVNSIKTLSTPQSFLSTKRKEQLLEISMNFRANYSSFLFYSNLAHQYKEMEKLFVKDVIDLSQKVVTLKQDTSIEEALQVYSR